MKLTDSEWAVMELLWSGESFALGEISVNGWNKNTVHTYLVRMNKKGLVSIDKGKSKPYSAAVTREDCARKERNELLSRVYGGKSCELVAAFLKDSSISKAELQRLRRLLDEMEV